MTELKSDSSSVTMLTPTTDIVSNEIRAAETKDPLSSPRGAPLIPASQTPLRKESTVSAAPALPRATPDSAKISDATREKWLLTAKSFVAGGVAGAVSRTAVSPLERLKILYMCGDATTHNQGVAGSLRRIWREDGFRGFFRGNGANVVRIFPFSAIQLSTYPRFKAFMSTVGTNDGKAVTSSGRMFCAGVAAGVTATSLTYPLDFIRSRLSLQKPGMQIYSGIWDGLRQVVRADGFLGVYRGLMPTLAGIIPYSGTQLMVYDSARQFAAARRPGNKPTQMDFFLGGALAGAVAQTIAFPFELVRRRMQTQGFGRPAGEAPRYTGMLQCARSVLQQDGFLGLYRGLFPNYLKIIPAAGISFLVFEQVKTLLGVAGGSPL